MIKKVVDVRGRELSLSTGRMARQADGSVIAQHEMSGV
jgi:polyribonucleotide nucleotidyltransferase